MVESDRVETFLFFMDGANETLKSPIERTNMGILVLMVSGAVTSSKKMFAFIVGALVLT